MAGGSIGLYDPPPHKALSYRVPCSLTSHPGAESCLSTQDWSAMQLQGLGGVFVGALREQYGS